MRLPDEPEIPLAINIVPLIDVMFALLTFFIISTLFLTRSEGLPVNLPKAATGHSGRSAAVTVTIDRQGQLSVNHQAVGLDALEGAVRQLQQPNQELLVVLNADEQVNHGQVISVMARLRLVQGAKLAIATQKP